MTGERGEGDIDCIIDEGGIGTGPLPRATTPFKNPLVQYLIHPTESRTRDATSTSLAS